MEIRVHSTGCNAPWRNSYVLSHVTISIGCLKLGRAETRRGLPQRNHSIDAKSTSTVNCVPHCFLIYMGWDTSVWLCAFWMSEFVHAQRQSCVTVTGDCWRRGRLFSSSVLLFGLLTRIFHYICQSIRPVNNSLIQNHCCLLDLGSPLPTFKRNFKRVFTDFTSIIQISMTSRLTLKQVFNLYYGWMHPFAYVTINRYNKPSSATMSQRALLTRISHYMFRIIPMPSSGVSYTEQ
jgi:hypothetical protein